MLSEANNGGSLEDSRFGQEIELTVLGIHHSTSWAEVPTALLQAEIARRQNAPAKPECGSGHTTKAYDTPLHFFALLLILGLSVGGPFLFRACSMSSKMTRL